MIILITKLKVYIKVMKGKVITRNNILLTSF